MPPNILSGGPGPPIMHRLRLIKTYLRNSMSQERLNHCLLVHVHRQKTDELECCDIAKEFISRNERRRNYFGN